MLNSLASLVTESGFAGILAAGGWKNFVMIIIACVLLYLGIKKQYEPLLMVGIAVGCLLANISYFEGMPEKLLTSIVDSLFGEGVYAALSDKDKNAIWDKFSGAFTSGTLLPAGNIAVTALRESVAKLGDLLLETLQNGLSGKDFDNTVFTNAIKGVFFGLLDDMKNKYIEAGWARVDALIAIVDPSGTMNHTSFAGPGGFGTAVGQLFQKALTSMGDTVLSKLTNGIVDLPTFITFVSRAGAT